MSKLGKDLVKLGKPKGYKLTQDDFGTLCICAVRYCHGRRTYMPSLVREIITPHLAELSDKDIAVMIEDCAFQRRFDLYGDENIDKKGWLDWEQMLIQEQKRRNNVSEVYRSAYG